MFLEDVFFECHPNMYNCIYIVVACCFTDEVQKKKKIDTYNTFQLHLKIKMYYLNSVVTFFV